jgi:hypothetical protein
MRSRLNSRRGSLVRLLANRSLIVLAVALFLFTSGCMKSLREHSTALAAATAPVIDQARAAYQATNAIHEKRADYDEIPVFEQDHSIDKLKVVHELIDDKDIELRLKVLTAFQLYVKTLVEITNGTESPELDAASKSLGKDLTGLGNTVAPTIENVLGIPATGPTTTVTTTTATTGNTTASTSTSTTTPAAPITTADQNLIITGANALGQFLTYRAIEKDLPSLIVKLDPQVISLCKVMISEVDDMSNAEMIDFNYMLGQQKQFVMDPSTALNEAERRNEVAKMQELVREQHVAELQLAGLRGAILKLALTHHALAEDLAKANPESLKEKLKELIAAGQNLGSFYTSLPRT